MAQHRRGRKQIACDRCAQRKRKCNQQMPCDGCVEHSDECAYTRFQQCVGETRPEELPPNPTDSQDFTSMLDTLETTATNTSAVVDENTSWLDAMDSGASVESTDAQYAEDNAILDLDGTLAAQPTSPEMMRYQPLNWPAVMNWHMSFMPTLGSSFGQISRPKLAFLARFTSTSGIANSFDCGSSEQRKEIMLSLLSSLGSDDIPGGMMMNRSILQSPGMGDVDQLLGSSYDNGDTLSPSTMTQHAELAFLDNTLGSLEASPNAALYGQSYDDLAAKTHEIVQNIREVVQHKSPKSRIKISWSPSREMLCYRFFSPANLENFLMAFWALWYPNWPVFHKPTFCATQKPASLLSAMVIIGATLTSERTDRDQAMVWADAVEEWVFTEDAFCDIDIPQTDDVFEEAQIEARLDALRAAYSVVLFLTWEGSEEQKKRARRTRFSQVVSVARSLRVSAAVHDNLAFYLGDTNPARSWRIFILKEELIRSLLYVFLLDCSYTMFNNCVPRMTTFELQFNMACPEVCFQAETVRSWLQTINSWLESYIGRHRPLLSRVVEVVTMAELSKEDWSMLREMSYLNFFAVASALHNMIFCHHCVSAPTHSIEVSPITHGLQNWWYAWISRQQLHSIDVDPTDTLDISSRWRRLGFSRYAAEFWNLACIMYKQPLRVQGPVLDGAQRSGRSIRNTYLKNFDESDMEQVHELIMQFQDLSAGDNSGIPA